MRLLRACGLATAVGAAILAAQACALPGYTTSSSGGTGGAGAAGAGGAGGASGAGGGTTSSGGGGGGPPACEEVPGYEVIACDLSGPGVIALDDTHAYWADDTGNVLRAAKTPSSAPEIVVPGAEPICSMVLRNNTLAWRTTAHAIWRMALPGTTPVLVTTEGDSFSCEISLDAGHVYFFGPSGGDYLVRRADLSGGPPVAISQTIMLPLSLDVSRDPANHYLYWSDIMDGKVFAVDLASPMPVGPLNTGGVNSIAADGATAYYLRGTGSGQPSTIMKDVVNDVGDATVAVMQSGPGSIRVTSSDVFWLVGRMDPGPIYAEVRRAQKTDMSVPGEVLASGLGAICGLAVDEQHVYFTTCGAPGAGRVLRRSHLPQ